MPATAAKTDLHVKAPARLSAALISAGRQRASRDHFPRIAGTKSGWTVLSLKDLRVLAHCFRGDLTETAAALGETRARCNIALNALLGRTEAEALAVLEKRA